MAPELALVRAIYLSNRLCPADFLVQCAASDHWLDRLAVARNPVTPMTALQQLAADGNRYVRAAATEAMGRPGLAGGAAGGPSASGSGLA
jgi:hypothetical protein